MQDERIQRRKARCWFADLPDAGPCNGRLVRCHLIPQQLLRREVGRAANVLWDSRVWVYGCGGPVGTGGHHGALDYARTLRVPRELLPPEVEEFAAEHGLVWWLERTYAGEPKRSARQQTDELRALSRDWKARNAEHVTAYARAYSKRDPCPWCGGPYSRPSGPTGRGYCNTCRDWFREVRDSIVEGMWAEGWPGRDIGAVIGVDPGVTVDRLRKAGRAPLRQRPSAA
jgi:hypothetical protein